MKKRALIASVLFLFLSTYNVNNNHKFGSKFKIKKIFIENNLILEEKKIKDNLLFLYQKNILFLEKKEIKRRLDELNFVESFKVKKIYPNKVKIKIFEAQPIAIIQNKKKRNILPVKVKLLSF